MPEPESSPLTEEEIPDEIIYFDAVLADASSPLKDKLKALLCRAGYRLNGGDWQGALEDTALVHKASADTSQVCLALLYSGVAYMGKLDFASAICEFTSATSYKTCTPKHAALALVNRAQAHKKLGGTEEALFDFHASLDQPGMSSDLMSRVLIFRATLLQEIGAHRLALADYARVLRLDNPDTDTTALCIINRSPSLYATGHVDKLRASSTFVIENLNFNIMQRALARLNRGVADAQMGDFDSAKSDFDLIISDERCPTSPKVVAYANRIMLHADRWDFDAMMALIEQAMGIPELGQVSIAWLSRRRDQIRKASQSENVYDTVPLDQCRLTWGISEFPEVLI